MFSKTPVAKPPANVVPSVPSSQPVTGADRSTTAEQPSKSPGKSAVLFSKSGQPPQYLIDRARDFLNRKSRMNPQMPYRKREPHQHNLPQLLELAKQLKASPKPEKPFDILAAIRSGEMVPTTDPKQRKLEQPASSPSRGKGDLQTIDGMLSAAPATPFRPVRAHELKAHYDVLTSSSKGKGLSFSDSEEVNGYFHRIGGHLNPFESVPTAGEQLKRLNSYILHGDGSLGLSGDKRLGHRTFGSRLEALHHLCFNTEFLRKAGPRDAAFYMGLYEQLAKEWKTGHPAA